MVFQEFLYKVAEIDAMLEEPEHRERIRQFKQKFGIGIATTFCLLISTVFVCLLVVLSFGDGIKLRLEGVC